MLKPVFKELQGGKKANRSGILHTRDADVLTPFFMPVATRGAVKGLEPGQVAATGAQVLLANTYHLHLSPGEKTVKKLGGIQKFANWQGPMLTDSGGFQVFSLAKVRKITEEGVEFKDPKTGDIVFISPEKSMQIQLDLGADIIMAFDDLTGLDSNARTRTTDAVDRTHRWLVRCIAEFKKLTKNVPESQKPLLFGIQQGGLDKKLRKMSLEFVQSQSISGVAIGGLSVGESRAEMHEMLEYLAPLYDKNRVRYLMGVGDPVDARFAIEHGIDMMDCVMPTRNARHGSVWVRNGCTASSCQSAEPPAPKRLTTRSGVKTSGFPSEYHEYTSVRSSAFPSSASVCSRCGAPFDSKLNLTNSKFANDLEVIDKNCDCHSCRTGFSRAFLRQLYRSENPLGGSLASIHNLRYLARIFEEYH